MFCINCGQQLPDNAKFCLNCGTPQVEISSASSTVSEPINIDGTHTFVPAMCPNCNAHMNVDSAAKVAHCPSCATECLVQDAIKALTVNGNVQVGNATITVNGLNTEALLKRVEMMIADGYYDGAYKKIDVILDSDPTNADVKNRISNICLRKYKSCLEGKSDLERFRIVSALGGHSYSFRDYDWPVDTIRWLGDENIKKELQEYHDSIIAAQEINEKKSQVGDLIHFGNDGYGRVLWWKVLYVRNQMAFIISSDLMEEVKYHDKYEDVAWEKCTLRSWLNNEFLNKHFTPEEQKRIIACRCNNDDNPERSTPGGVPTIDKVTLLSINEASQLFSNDQARKAGQYNENWWLRSPGWTPKNAAYVSNGRIVMSGYSVNSTSLRPSIKVRPAMWIKLE